MAYLNTYRFPLVRLLTALLRPFVMTEAKRSDLAGERHVFDMLLVHLSISHHLRPLSFLTALSHTSRLIVLWIRHRLKKQ